MYNVLEKFEEWEKNIKCVDIDEGICLFFFLFLYVFLWKKVIVVLVFVKFVDIIIIFFSFCLINYE